MIKIDSSFHPLMFCFSGFSGSGKTTIISKLIKELQEFKIGYIKHDCHGFEIDKEGKDTFVMSNAGAEIVMINDREQFAVISKRSSFYQDKNLFLDSDLVLIEGHKYSKLPKVIIVDEEEKILKEIKEGRVELPMAFVTTAKSKGSCLEFYLPCFDRDDIKGIADFIRAQVITKNISIPLYGLVLSGGFSSRMKRDKGELNYHGISQVEYAFDLLTPSCEKVFVSCRREQSNESHVSKLPQIHDRFLDSGPLGGILSAMSAHRNAAWLVLACDLPLMNESVLKALLEKREIHKMGTAFYNLDEKRFEPLAALYEPKSFHKMLYFLAEGKTCPQKILYNSEIGIINIRNKDSFSKLLVNANTQEDYQKIILELGDIKCP